MSQPDWSPQWGHVHSGYEGHSSVVNVHLSTKQLISDQYQPLLQTVFGTQLTLQAELTQDQYPSFNNGAWDLVMVWMNRLWTRHWGQKWPVSNSLILKGGPSPNPPLLQDPTNSVKLQRTCPQREACDCSG